MRLTLVDCAAVGNWRKRLGARLIVERVQVKEWNVTEAAKKAKIDPGTVRRIEAGQNYEVDKLERYVESFGRPLETWLREILEERSQDLSASPLGEAKSPPIKKGRRAAG